MMRKRLFCILTAIAVLCCTVSTSALEMVPYMTYRENAVILSAASDIHIVNGAFTVTDLCVTTGQDPSGLNYVGQIHTLENGRFTFEVGRSGSSEVADWFNAKFSGYNSDSVNGDRTTFDQTAEKLNFAFQGDLNLTVTTANCPQGVSVTFPGVVFAQGSTLFSNNWWFGQLSGQHTRDGDGPYSMLAVGNDTSGNTVFASFLRGDNAVNEVSLNGLYIAGTAKDRAAEISDVQQTFSLLPVDGLQSNLSGFPGSYDPTVNHIQGYTQYDSAEAVRYSILTHSVGTSSYAHIVAGPKAGGEKWGFKTYLEKWRHPGGVQVIGDYLLVPTEQDTEAHVALYDLRSLAVKELRRVESFDLKVDHKAGALGITSYTDANGITYYILIVAHLDGKDSVYHVYRAVANNGIENAAFTEVGSFGLEKDFQGFGLVTEDGTGDIYMIGLWSPEEGATYADFAYLYRLDTQTWTIGEELSQIHLISKGGAAGLLGVHFRYGAGVYVSEDAALTISATERNSVLGSALATNDWIPVTAD